MTTSDEATRSVSRRGFISRTAVTGLGIALVGSVDTLFGAGNAAAAPGGVPGRPGTPGPAPGPGTGYGPLVADPRGILALPRGFSYSVVAQAGVTTMEGGVVTPSDPDGTAAFTRPGGRGAVLVNNHEIGGDEPYRVPAVPGLTYDPGAGGGTTTIEVDQQGRRVAERVSLAGTHNNCAGGRTPWNTWVSCEETEAVPTAANGLTQRHGYCFEVDPYDQAANRDPRPIKALGRFAHEAVVVDPDTSELYLTEDAANPNGLLYRWTPPAAALPLGKGSLRRLGPTDGTLAALRATRDGVLVPDLNQATEIGTTYAAEWVTVPDRDAATTSTRLQAYAQPITRARKLEGMWWGDGGVYFVSSFDRSLDAPHDGQVWFLDPLADTIRLTLRFAYTPADQDSDVDGPDNITVSPYGGLIIAEDGEGKQHLVGSNSAGETFFFARNDLSGSELAGPTFSPDRKTLFVGIQEEGYVLAIQGPFARQH